MASRSNGSKKKPAKPARRATAARSPKAPKPAAKTGVYISVGDLTVALSSERPKGSQVSGPYVKLEDAKAAALDALVAAIEKAERQLARVRAATSLDALNSGG